MHEGGHAVAIMISDQHHVLDDGYHNEASGGRGCLDTCRSRTDACSAPASTFSSSVL